ncbi:uncharacterized protein BBOV_IV001790 [Babesia bovis T2Bo]|uniref:Uncharacterized protein n=1 Tax=Babesia bovis TaxID=5865 RepID=A7AVF0_BABBO|nr:uncharacterized protein BBOV_IV001790 [Babesia bovis T2Bo]EDO05776.1 hypothetical protein BBOV_IV001790 [Babesia bovis T2Bo]|eukprot:XP_001609344.1 hypothetical protein [Babesia bovis T2Bo]
MVTEDCGIQEKNHHSSASFRISFSALSLRKGNGAICAAPEPVDVATDNIHDDASSIESTCFPNASLVTFSLKILCKDNKNPEDWQLCCKSETQPIVTHCIDKGGTYISFLLNYTESLPLFLKRRVFSKENETVHRTNPQLDSSVVETTAQCHSPDKLLESQIFKISIGVAIVNSGKVVYVGHGSRILRSIDLYGNRISLQLSGDFCNRNIHSRKEISDAFVFFDVDARNVRWIPSTEHCPMPTNHISENSARTTHFDIMPAVSLNRSVKHANASINRNINQDNLSGINDYAVEKTTEKRKQYMGDDIRVMPHSFPVSLNGLPQRREREVLQSTIYVSSDPKYKISVLDINNLSGDPNCWQAPETWKKPPTTELLQKKDNVKILNPQSSRVLTKTNEAADNAPVDVVSQQERVTKSDVEEEENKPGFLAEMWQSMFGGNEENAPEVVGDPQIDNVQSIIEPVPVKKEIILRAKKYSDVNVDDSKPTFCRFTIGYKDCGTRDAALLESASQLFDCTFANISDIISTPDFQISIENVCIKPKCDDSIAFSVTIPSERSNDVAYIKNMMLPFSKLSLNSIDSISFLLRILHPVDLHSPNDMNLPDLLKSMDLGSVMSVVDVSVGSDPNKLSNDIEAHEKSETLPLRKSHSETAIYCNDVLSKGTNQETIADHIPCISARDSMSTDTWMQMINRILDNRSDGMIQITSPRSSLPIHLDQKWVVVLKQLLNTVKDGNSENHSTEDVKFTWSSL